MNNYNYDLSIVTVMSKEKNVRYLPIKTDLQEAAESPSKQNGCTVHPSRLVSVGGKDKLLKNTQFLRN